MIGKKLAGVFGTTIVAAMITGCDSHERHAYTSTPSVPQTVALRDITTGEQLWSYDVPPGQELKLWFKYSKDRANEQGFDEMTWVVGPVGQGVPPNQNTMKVPPPMARRIEGSVRAPELLKVPQKADLTPTSPAPAGS